MTEPTREQVVAYLRNFYQETHYMKQHQDRLASRLIAQAIAVLENRELEELANCDCYECVA